MIPLFRVLVGKKATNLKDAFIELRQRIPVSHIEERELFHVVYLYDYENYKRAIHFLESEGVEIL